MRSISKLRYGDSNYEFDIVKSLFPKNLRDDNDFCKRLLLLCKCLYVCKRSVDSQSAVRIGDILFKKYPSDGDYRKVKQFLYANNTVFHKEVIKFVRMCVDSNQLVNLLELGSLIFSSLDRTTIGERRVEILRRYTVNKYDYLQNLNSK
ncbi:MAG: hypothetical protein HC836_40450 [Richelia sp. RM2_1_2]|nr:hypothetical protein [Richelia sp. RM2_1_2]